MDPLLHLAIIWAAVFVAVVASKKTRLTPVLYFLFIGCVLANTGLAFVVMDIAYVQHSIVPVEAFYTLMITAFCLNVLVPVTNSWWRPHYLNGALDPPS